MARESSILQINRRIVGKGLRCGLFLSVYERLAEFEAEWRELETHAEYTPFQSFDWVNCWLSNVGRGKNTRPVLVVIRNDRGAPALVAPLGIECIGPFRVLTWLGSQINDYNAPILGSDDTDYQRIHDQFADIWSEVIEHLRSIKNCGFDLVNFSKMPALMGKHQNPFVKLDVTLNPNRAHAASLPATWDEMYGRRSSNTRNRDRSKLRRLNELGEVKYFDPKNAPEKLAITRKLLQMKSHQLAEMGARNRFASESYRDFIEAVSSLDGSTHISALQLGRNVVAANLGFILNKRYYHFLMAYDHGEVSKFGPGAAHLRELLQFAIRSGAKTFDFTIGDEAYKKDWCDQEMQLYDQRTSQTFRGQVALFGVQNFYRLKRLIKNNDWAWPAYLKLRSTLAKLRRRKGTPALK